MTLNDYLETRYELKRSICQGTADGYRQAVRSLERFAGREVTLGELTPDLVNAWIRSLKVAATTIAHRRRHALTLWRAASEDELCSPPALWKIRRVRTPPKVPVAWSAEEVRLLAHAAKQLDGDYPKIGVRRSFFWQVAIRVGWDTALRTGDLLALDPSAFRSSHHRVVVVQHKTGKPVLVALHATTMSFLRAVPHWPFIVWWPYTDEYFRTEFAEIVKLASLKGSFKKLRKSSGSDVEKTNPGWGSAHLGHSFGPKISHMFYFDPTITGCNKPMPEEL